MAFECGFRSGPRPPSDGLFSSLDEYKSTFATERMSLDVWSGRVGARSGSDSDETYDTVTERKIAARTQRDDSPTSTWNHGPNTRAPEESPDTSSSEEAYEGGQPEPDWLESAGQGGTVPVEDLSQGGTQPAWTETPPPARTLDPYVARATRGWGERPGAVRAREVLTKILSVLKGSDAHMTEMRLFHGEEEEDDYERYMLKQIVCVQDSVSMVAVRRELDDVSWPWLKPCQLRLEYNLATDAAFVSRVFRDGSTVVYVRASFPEVGLELVSF